MKWYEAESAGTGARAGERPVLRLPGNPSSQTFQRARSRLLVSPEPMPSPYCLGVPAMALDQPWLLADLLERLSA